MVKKQKETEDAFADELQILARKVMTRKPNFRQDLDSTLKQRYMRVNFLTNIACINRQNTSQTDAQNIIYQIPQRVVKSSWNLTTSGDKSICQSHVSHHDRDGV